MNLIDIEDRLKDLSDQQLMQQMQRPDGMAPQFLVMSELKRRKEMRGRAPTQPDNSTVKDDLLGQGIASAMPQQPMPQQPMPQDGIPRFQGGVFLNTGPLSPTSLRQGYGSGSRSPISFTGPSYRQRRARGTGYDLSQSPYVLVPGYKGDDIGFYQNPPTYSGGPQMVGEARDPGTYDYNLAQDLAETDDAGSGMGANISRTIFNAAQTAESIDRLGDYAAEDQQATEAESRTEAPPPAPVSNTGFNRRSSILGGFIPGQGMPSGTGGDYGEVNAATDYDRAYNQIMSAPPTAAPAAPPTNYYEGIEKKLAALQEAETGPDVGMALLRAGLGVAQAGGEGKSTAAAIGAGGIAGLDAYEADKKAKQARQMQLMGVESQLAGAKTQQAYNQQKLALDTRMRDNQDKMLQLKGLGMSMEDNRYRDLAANQNQLKFMQLQLQEQKINFDADLADRKLKQMVDEGKIKGDYYEALTDKANRGDSLDRYLNATPEERQLLLPLLRKNNASLQGDIGESAMKLIADPLWVNQARERLKKEAGGGEIGINAVVMEARRLSELGYGQGGGAPQGPRDDARIRR